ncbi:hypothetical protein ACUXV3_10975 [Roseobacteraceae bacterium NS-SX3]
MTSEICVMNRMSVVLAADSASTVSYYENGEQHKRYFKGANKVFQLSDTQPVGLMIYGNAEIMGVPWELVIKAFRKHLNNSSFDTIEGYAKAFQQFLNDNQQFFPSDARDAEFERLIALETAISCDGFNRNREEDDSFAEDAHIAILEERIAQLDFQNGLDNEFVAGLLAQTPQNVLQKLREGEGYPYLEDRTDAQLLKIIELNISLKAKQYPDNSTGLVFAGFGDASIYPEAFAAKSTGFIAGQLVMANSQFTQISPGNNSYISGYAQSSMADTFIVGFDAEAYSTMQAIQRYSLPDMLAPFVSELGGTTEQTEAGTVLKNAEGEVLIDELRFDQLALEVLRPVGDNILKESRQKHGAPLERVISMLPVEEMAELAATMVDLQSLKEKVTRPSETVGGPVDVAIITKNEGLVWKKRKHFFDIDLNQRYLHRLQSKD